MAPRVKSIQKSLVPELFDQFANLQNKMRNNRPPLKSTQWLSRSPGFASWDWWACEDSWSWAWQPEAAQNSALEFQIVERPDKKKKKKKKKKKTTPQPKMTNLRNQHTTHCRKSYPAATWD
jgi:hypothetical protein